MQRFILLDANLLIGAFDHDKDNPKHIEAKQLVNALLLDDTVKIAITPLIRYEVMRGVKRISLEQMQAILDDFQEFEITDKEGNFASHIYRKTNKQTDKHNFDIFHFAVCQIRQLEWQSLDKDFTTLQNALTSPIH